MEYFDDPRILAQESELQDERRANLAIGSWGIERFQKLKSDTVLLDSTIDLKEFLHQRGEQTVTCSAGNAVSCRR